MIYSLANLLSISPTYIGDGIIILILLISVIVGIHKGFLGMIVSLIASIATIVLSSLLCKPFSLLLDSTFNLNEVFTNLFAGMFTGETFTTPIQGLVDDKITELIASLDLPEFITKSIQDLALSKAHVQGGELTLQSIIAEKLSEVALTATSWLILFLLLSIVFFIIKRFVKIFDKIAIIGTINKVLGGVLAFLLALLAICVVMYIFILISSLVPSSAVEYVKECKILGFFYNQNILAQILTRIFA